MLLCTCLVLFVSGCDESDDVASALLYEDEGDSGSVSFRLQQVGQWQLNTGEILYGFDMQVTNNSQDEPAENIRIDLDGLSPENLIMDYSTERREMSFLTPSETRLFDSYFCFFCNQANEVRVGNFYAIISTSAGSGTSYELLFNGRYNLAGETVEVNLTPSFSTVGSATPAPQLLR